MAARLLAIRSTCTWSNVDVAGRRTRTTCGFIFAHTWDHCAGRLRSQRTSQSEGMEHNPPRSCARKVADGQHELISNRAHTTTRAMFRERGQPATHVRRHARSIMNHWCGFCIAEHIKSRSREYLLICNNAMSRNRVTNKPHVTQGTRWRDASGVDSSIQ